MWWTLKSMYLGPGHVSAALNCTTSQDDHLYVAFAPWRPTRTALWRIFRGKDYLCGYKYTWDTPTIVEQQLPGDTEFHLFVLTDLTPSTIYWGYMFAPDGHYGNEIQGPLFHFITTAVPPGPQPTPAPINFHLLNRSIRCGNRYTWWANQTWYAMVPCIDSLTVWKYQVDTMVRKDQAHEPVPPAGFIHDADSRMDPLGETLHASYFIRTVGPAPHLLRYATFDLTTDTWALDEPICSPTRSAWGGGDTSISLDAANVPHVVYTDHGLGIPIFRYRNRIGGVWSASEIAMERFPRVLLGSSVDHDPATNHFHFLCVASHNWVYINKRSPAGVWDGRTWLDPVGINLPHHSITAGVELPQMGQIGLTFRVNFHESVFPYLSDLDLSDPVSGFANVIPGPLVAFRDADFHLAYVYRPPAAEFDPPVQLDPDGVGILTANHAPPDVVSCLWEQVGINNLALYAFWAPWH